jgi:hypothetical protein
MQLDLLEGRKLKDEGIDRVSKNYPDFLTYCRAIAYSHADKFGTVSINDVREQIHEIPEGVNPNVLGAVFREKHFEAVGFIEAKHPSAHARIVRVYQLRRDR